MLRNKERGWELPGGKFHDGEGPAACALREFIEETGHFLLAPKFVLKQDRPHRLAWIFTGQLGPAIQGRKLESKFSELAWFSKLPEKIAFPDDPYQEIGDALGLKF